MCVLLIVLLCLCRLIQQCAANSSKAITTELWTKSGLTWTALGLDQPEEEFLEREVPLYNNNDDWIMNIINGL